MTRVISALCRFCQWFLGRRPRPRIWERDDEGWATSRKSLQRYHITVAPGDGQHTDAAKVYVRMHVNHNAWLAGAPYDILQVEAEPEGIQQGITDIIAEADRRVAAVMAAREHGYKPQR